MKDGWKRFFLRTLIFYSMIFIIFILLGAAMADTLQLPKETKTIENEAFAETKGLDEVLLPEGIEKIGYRAFANSSIRRINFPVSLNDIDDSAFYNCSDLTVSAVLGTYGYNWAVAHQIPIEADSPYTLDIYWVGNGDNNVVRTGVEEAISNYVKPLIGADVSFHIIGWGDWNEKAIQALERGEKIDLLFTADWEGYGYEVNASLLKPLDELIEQYGSGIKASLPQAYLNGAKVNGVVYAIPTNKEICIPQGFIINKTAANAIGWDVQPDDPGIRETADLEPWLAKYKQAYPNKYPYLMDSYRWADEPWVPDWAGLDLNAVAMKMTMDENGSFDETIYSIFHTIEQENHIRLMYDWAQKGYISPRAYRTDFDYNGIFGRGDFLAYTQPLMGNGIKSRQLYAANATAEFECVEITLQSKYIVTTHTGGSMFGIPVTSERPDIAMKYLNLMHSDKTLINMMLFGVEGVNFYKVGEETVSITPDANWYGVHGGAWTVGNTALQYVTEGDDPETNAKLQQYGRDAIETISLGFRFVKDNVSDLIISINEVVNDMGIRLMTGSTDPDDPSMGIGAFRTALENAGITELIREIQIQYDAWKVMSGQGN